METLKIIPTIQSAVLVKHSSKLLKKPNSKNLIKNFADISIGVNLTKLTSDIL